MWIGATLRGFDCPVAEGGIVVDVETSYETRNQPAIAIDCGPGTILLSDGHAEALILQLQAALTEIEARAKQVPR